jgi:hypothetical protein
MMYDTRGPDPVVFGPAHHNDVLHAHEHQPRAPGMSPGGTHIHPHLHPGDKEAHSHPHRHQPGREPGAGSLPWRPWTRKTLA